MLIFIIIIGAIFFLLIIFTPTVPQKWTVEQKMQNDAIRLSIVLEEYKTIFGHYPSETDGLIVLLECIKSQKCNKITEKGFIDSLNDPWGTPYKYVLENNRYSIFSIDNKDQHENKYINIINNQ